MRVMPQSNAKLCPHSYSVLSLALRSPGAEQGPNRRVALLAERPYRAQHVAEWLREGGEHARAHANGQARAQAHAPTQRPFPDRQWTLRVPSLSSALLAIQGEHNAIGTLLEALSRSERSF